MVKGGGFKFYERETYTFQRADGPGDFKRAEDADAEGVQVPDLDGYGGRAATLHALRECGAADEVPVW